MKWRGVAMWGGVAWCDCVPLEVVCNFDKPFAGHPVRYWDFQIFFGKTIFFGRKIAILPKLRENTKTNRGDLVFIFSKNIKTFYSQIKNEKH